MTTPRNRAAIVGHGTRYEVAIMRPNAAPVVLGYTARHTRAVLRSYAADNWSACKAALGGEDATWSATRKAFVAPSGLAIGFTGRTERDAAALQGR